VLFAYNQTFWPLLIFWPPQISGLATPLFEDHANSSLITAGVTNLTYQPILVSSVSVALNQYRRLFFLDSFKTTCVNMAVR